MEQPDGLREAQAGIVAAQDRAVRETGAEIVAFSDANSIWEPDALRLLVRNFADPDVAYVCGKLAAIDRPAIRRRVGATRWPRIT